LFEYSALQRFVERYKQKQNIINLLLLSSKLTSWLSTGCDHQRLLAASLVSAHVIQAFAVQQQHILYLYNISCYRHAMPSG
jgi:hypothetical protein